MSGRELVVLGTAAQVPTRTRAHNSCLLRWDGSSVLLDPGEGTQRQLTLAGVSPSTIEAICITHVHGDHCLGLPGVLQRMALDGTERPVDVYFPAEGADYVGHLLSLAPFTRAVEVRARPVAAPGHAGDACGLRIVADSLDHRVQTFGWRLEEPARRHMLPERLEAAGVRGADVAILQRDGGLGRVRLEDVSETRRGHAVAFVMDTAPCDAAVRLARDADVVVCEATFLERDAHLARSYGHLTAAQAAHIAANAGARALVLTHFSQRYGDNAAAHAEEARRVFQPVVAAHDLARVPVPYP